MFCLGCSSDKATFVKTRVDENGSLQERCNRCSTDPIPGTPDIYYAPGETHDENILEKDGRYAYYNSKRGKAEVLKRLNLAPASSAERWHGERNEMYLHRRKYSIG